MKETAKIIKQQPLTKNRLAIRRKLQLRMPKKTKKMEMQRVTEPDQSIGWRRAGSATTCS